MKEFWITQIGGAIGFGIIIIFLSFLLYQKPKEVEVVREVGVPEYYVIIPVDKNYNLINCIEESTMFITRRLETKPAPNIVGVKGKDYIKSK